MECVFQILNKTNGQRSPAMKVTRGEFANKASQLSDQDKYMVIVLMDQRKGPNEWDFSDCPLYELEHFVKEFANVQG